MAKDRNRKSRERYGSSYDPRREVPSFYERENSPFGKIERPQEIRSEEFQVGGCGDPRCNMCNPETSQAIDSGAISGSVLDALMRTAMENRGRNFSITLSNGGYDLSSMIQMIEPTRNLPSVDAEYQEAREAVKEYLKTVPREQSFDDIIGNEKALSQLRDAIEAPVKHKKVYEAYGMQMPKGAMLSGPPGCGKTMFARAAVGAMKELYGSSNEFISISGSSIQSPYVGVTEGIITAIFKFARAYKKKHGHPLLIFIDEAEVLLPDRTGRVRRVSSWEESQVATFLAEMDGMQESGAFVLLATNRPNVIDQAVLRDGRCDFKIVVKKPTIEAVEMIIKRNFVDVLIHPKCNVNELVFAAVESFRDPHKIITGARAIDETGEIFYSRDFTLEHIVSGAMAASVPQRAKRYAFNRDKLKGAAVGVMTEDVMAAVKDIFEENKNLEHSFALNAFKEKFAEEATATKEMKDKPDRKMN